MLQFGLRLGERPRQVVTTTPRPIPLLKRLIADPATVVSRARDRGERRQSRAGLPQAVVGALSRARGSAGRSLTAS